MVKNHREQLYKSLFEKIQTPDHKFHSTCTVCLHNIKQQSPQLYSTSLKAIKWGGDVMVISTNQK